MIKKNPLFLLIQNHLFSLYQRKFKNSENYFHLEGNKKLPKESQSKLTFILFAVSFKFIFNRRKELESETPEVNESRCEFWKTVIKGGEMDLCDLVSIASERNGVDWCCAFLKKNTELLPLNREIKVKNTRRKNSVKNWDSLF